LALEHDRQGFRKRGLSFTMEMRDDLVSAVHKLDTSDEWEEGTELTDAEVHALLAYLVSERYRKRR
jgi:hypothetical protein